MWHVQECADLPIRCLEFVLGGFPAQVHVRCERQNAGIERDRDLSFHLVVAVPCRDLEASVHDASHLHLVPRRFLGENQPELRLIRGGFPIRGVVNLESQR